MEELNRGSLSVWMDTGGCPSFPPLSESTTTDVCIIGAGVVGITTAYMLAREGRKVLVLDANAIGGVETLRTTAHLSNANDDYYVHLERQHGEKGSRLAAESHTSAIDRIEAIVAEEQIECGFTRLDGYLFVAPGEPPEFLNEELAAAHRAGLTSVYRLERSVLSSFDCGPSLCFPRQAQFNIAPYLKRLIEVVQARGGRFHGDTHVSKIEGGPTARIETTSGRSVEARAVVVATNTPINDRVVMHTKLAGYQSYVIALPVPRGSVPLGLYWDTADPYHYVRLHSDMRDHAEEDLLIIGGEDHKTGQANDAQERYSRLEAWTRKRFAGAGEVAYRWSGQLMESIDGLAYIGRNPLDAENVYIVTGDSGHGITHGTIAGMLLTDLIQGRPNPWEDLYDPSRKNVASVGNYFRENLNVAAQYTDFAFGDSVNSVDEIPNGEGAVLHHGLMRIAAYRDENGTLHECSAVCPHLGCIVGWNSGEKTWDCPCHGSRFNAEGKVIHGPAVSSLGPVPESVLVQREG